MPKVWLPMELTVISTFAGCGGSSLGYKWAGFKELLAIEWEDHAVETFELNFPEVPMWQKDIREVTGQEILDFCNIKKGELDIFDGSPPCQGFSTAGKRQIDDIRNSLFIDFKRLVDELQPKIFVMENVTGMVKGKMKGRFLEILEELKELNYNVKCKLMNSKYYGVPQSRERLIFIGTRNDLNIDPIFPEPSNRITTVKKALKGVENKTFAPIANGQEIVFPYIKQGKSAINCVPKNILKEYIPKMVNNKKYSFGGICARLHSNKCSPTITKTFIKFSEPPIHPKECRVITIEESKRLCSFPDDFILTGKFGDQWARLGNAVMPKFMQAIAETLKNEILIHYYGNIKEFNNG